MNAKRSRTRWILRNLLRWDFFASVALTAAFLILVLPSERPLEDAATPLVAAVALGVAIAVGAAVAGRWLADRIREDTYGEVLRALDPDESKVQRPFLVVTITGIAISLGAVLLLVSRGEIGRTWTAVVYAGELFLGLYGLLGFLDLLLQIHRHQRRQAIMRSMKEAENRRTEQ